MNTASKTGTVFNSHCKNDSSTKKGRHQARIDMSKKNFLEILNNCMNSQKQSVRDSLKCADQTSID